MKFLFLLLYLTVSYSCINSQEKGYVNYFYETNKAALNILKSDYDAALTVYKSVFKSYPHSFYRDVHNACVCAIKLNKTGEAFEFAQMMVLHGYELFDFDKEPFVYLKNNKKQWRKFTNAYPKYRDKYIETVDRELRERYYALSLNDNLAVEYRLDKTIKEQDSLLYNLSVQLTELIEKNGFPNWMMNKDTMSFKLTVMLRHYHGVKNRIERDEELQNDALYASMSFDRLHSMVEDAFSKGLMLPDAYEVITTYWLRKNPYGVTTVKIDYDAEKVTPFLLLSPEEVVEANKNREV
ncbi:MAG: hypothetical protein LBV47_05645 [Bacteroidales bacterium]|jgi:DNA-binding transcriptional ArsR family regulator|nr:hypothetical protein [Bacteroidales bacterium]